MATSDPQLVVGWTQSQLTRVCQLLYAKYPVLQNIKYDAREIKIDAKLSSPSFIMPETVKSELFMVLRIKEGDFVCPEYKWPMNDWHFAYRCNLSRAKSKVSLSSEGLFQCLNTILDTDIDETYTILGGTWKVSNLKEEHPGSFEAINRGFKQWMTEQSANGLTQWGYRFPALAKSNVNGSSLIVMDLMQMAGLSGSAQSSRGLFYFEPPPDIETLDYLDEKYRHEISLSVFSASKRDKVIPDDPPRSTDLEAELDKLYGVGTICTNCGPAVLNSDFRMRTRLLKWQNSTVNDEPGSTILKSKIEVMGFIPGADVGNNTKVIPPIRLVEGKGAMTWDADCQGLKPIVEQPMSITFRGQNKTSAKVDILYFQFRFLGGSSERRLATTSVENTITVAVKDRTDFQAKVYHSSVRGMTRVVVHVSPSKPTDTKIKIAPDEKIEIELSGLAGTAATHEFDFTESLQDAQGQSGARRNSRWSLDIAPAS